MKRTLLLSFLAAFVLLLSSCKNENKSGLAIPKDAAVVFHIDASSLSSKLSWDDIKKTSWYQDLHQQAQKEDTLARKILDNPEASGIDVKSDFVFFIKKRGRGGYSMFEGSIKDAAAFEKMLKKMTREDKVVKDGEWNLLSSSSRSLVAWNNQKFAVINDMPIADVNPMGSGRMEGTETTRFGTDSLKVFVKEVMSLDNDESLFDDERFASVMKEKGDMHLWVNSSSLYADMAGMMSMMKAGSLLEGNASGATINFEDGKIAMKAKQFFGKEMQKAMEKWKIKNIDASVLNRIPSQDIIAVMAMNLDPQFIKEFTKTMGVDGMANSFLAKMDLTLDEILSATKGDFIVSVSDLQMKDTTVTLPGGDDGKPFVYTSSKPDVSFLVATSVNQKASFEKVLNTFKKESMELPVAYQLNNDWFAAGNKPEAVNAFLSGNNTTKHAFAEKISGHPFGLYIDIQRLLKTNFSKNPMVKSLLAESAAVWKDVVAVGYEFKDGVATSEMTINMIDGKTNSLKQLNQFIEKMNAARKANKMAFDNDDDHMPSTDSIMAIPPPPPVAEDRKQ